MSQDLVKRLRERKASWIGAGMDPDKLCQEAADRIEALERQIAAADKLADAVKAEHGAWVKYLCAPRDRGGDKGPKGQAQKEWHGARSACMDAFAAYQANMQVPQ